MVGKIVVETKSCKIIDDNIDANFLAHLDRELSFNIQGAQYTKAYQGYTDHHGNFIKWDGKKRLLNSNLSFPRGLLNKTLDLYKKFKINYEIEEKFDKTFSNEISILSSLERMNKSPRLYQIEAASKIKEYDCGILRMATGSGKTLTIALMTALLGKRTIVYVIGKGLLYQLHDFFQKVFSDQKIGIVGDGQCIISDINVVSIWTAGQALGMGKKKLFLADAETEVSVTAEKHKDIRALLTDTKVHIFDECHVAACNTIQEIYRHINPEHIYGMSATPWRDDGQDLMIEALLGKYIVNIPASELIEQGYLVRPYIRFVKVPPMKGKAPFQTMYKNYIVENEERNKLIVSSAKKLIDLKYKTLVLYNSVHHGEILQAMMEKELNCVLLSGKDDMDLREKAKEDLLNEKIDVILASKIFDIGEDIPFLSGLINGGGGASSVRTCQKVGRITRIFPGKKQGAVIDFYDQAKFLKDHSEARLKTYSSEPGYDVKGWS